jgi:hypothetical protein
MRVIRTCLCIADWTPVDFAYPQVTPIDEALDQIAPRPYRPYKPGRYQSAHTRCLPRITADKVYIDHFLA